MIRGLKEVMISIHATMFETVEQMGKVEVRDALLWFRVDWRPSDGSSTPD